MSRTKQLSLLKDPRKNTKLWWIKKQHVYGGSLNYRKVKRPFDSKKLVHAVFKAKLGPSLWMTHFQYDLNKIAKQAAKTYACKIKSIAINDDHIHLLFGSQSRVQFLNFLRFFSAEVGRYYKNLENSVGIRSRCGLWIERPFTRLVSWGKKSVSTALNYIKKNHNEALGFITYTKRKQRLSQFLINLGRVVESTA